MSAKPLSLTCADTDVRFKRIKLLLLDVDGVLTNGQIMWIKEQGWTRTYNITDGYGIRMVQDLGLKVGVISGGKSEELKERLKVLEIQHFVLGSEDKLTSLLAMAEETKIALDEICFVADELFDMPALRRVGISITVPDAAPEVLAITHYVTQKKGGQGAVREVIDVIRAAQNLHPDCIKG